MAAAYRLGSMPGSVQRTADGVWIPNDARNRDWKAYQAWLTAGGVPDPYVPPPPLPPQALTVQGTGNFWSQNGAIINRLKDRLFLGAATINDGALPVTNLDWLSQEANWSTAAGQLSVLADGGASAIVAGARTSDGQSAIATQSWAINDKTTAPLKNAWAIYAEGRRKPNTGPMTVVELDVTNQGEVVVATPFGLSGTQQASRALWLGSGGGAVGALSTGTLADATMALGITQNGVKFCTGILICAQAITGTDGQTGTGEAIAMAKGHRIHWYTAAGGSTPVAGVGCDDGLGAQLYSKGVTAIEAHAPATGETGLLLAVNRAGTTVMSQVTIGAPNSGGTGFRALVVAN